MENIIHALASNVNGSRITQINLSEVNAAE
jgi:hypothetical protein